MIREALQYVSELVTKGLKPEPVPTGDPAKLTYLVGGEVVEVPKAEPPRQHEATNLETLAAMTERFLEHGPSLWVDEASVVLLIDDVGRRASRVTMPVEVSEVFARLVALAREKEWLDQKAFVRLLRIDLAGTLPPGVLLDRVRKLRFESGQVTTSEAQRNRESMGRTITASVSAEGELPDAVTLEVRPFKGHGEFALTCSVDVDAARGLLQLAPLPDEIDRVKHLALRQIAEALGATVDGTVPVYLGKP